MSNRQERRHQQRRHHARSEQVGYKLAEHLRVVHAEPDEILGMLDLTDSDLDQAIAELESTGAFRRLARATWLLSNKPDALPDYTPEMNRVMAAMFDPDFNAARDALA